MCLSSTSSATPRILLTGATGYVGGRLLPRLEEHGCLVRCMSRRPDALRGRVARTTEVVAGDVLDANSLATALDGVEVAYYFVHSMGARSDFEHEDRKAASNFAAAARAAGVRRIIYLGGLGTADKKLSKHLRSRQETGDLLRASGAQVVEFRASIVIGSGSLSFELIRALVERLFVMICPKWVRVLAQPISIEDLLDYLIEAMNFSQNESEIFEIGGPDRVSYEQIMREYAEQRGLQRHMIPVPVLTPRLSSLWLGLVTPVYARVGRKLVESLRNPTVVSSRRAAEVFSVRPRGLRAAVERAITNEDREIAETRWSDALSSAGRPRSWGGTRFGSRLVDSRAVEVHAPAAQSFAAIQRIGGDTGWYYGNWLWKTRGFLDLLVGGVGIRRGRRDPINIRVGDAVDFWRVEQYEPGHLLRLQAEMKVPGRAWLEFEVTGNEQKSVIRQTALFDPVGLFGLAYWYLLYPLHQLVFNGMVRQLAKAVNRPGDTHEDGPRDATESRQGPTRRAPVG